MISLSRMVRIATRVAAWATPKVQKWNRDRNMNRTEARRHLAAHNWSEAEKYTQAALAERQGSAADRIELLTGLSRAQRGQGKLEDACQTALEAEKFAVEQRKDTLHSMALETVADVQLDLGRYAEAEKAAKEVIALEGKRPTPDYARLASCSRKLASALEHGARPGEAAEALKQAAGYAEKAFGAEHTETAAHLQELGMLHRRHGRHTDAQDCLRRALHIHRSATGVDSHAATEALHNLAASLEENGNAEEAAAEYEKLLAVRDRQVGANPVQTAEAQVRLAMLQLQAGRISSARELLLRAVPFLERKSGPLYATSLEALAVAEDLSGRASEAQRYRDKAQAAAALQTVA